MKPAPFTWVRAASVAEAVGILAADGGARVLAGGQSLLPLAAMRLARPTTLVDLEGAGLDGIEEESGGSGRLSIGAMVRQRRLELDAVVARRVPLLRDAVRHVGYPATRNRGTLGGSLAHADPVAELPAVAVALGATVVAEGPGGTRRIAAASLADGPFATTLAGAEVVTRVEFPIAGARHGAAWCEWSARAHDFPEAGAGVAVEVDEHRRIVSVAAAACGVGGGPLPLGAVVADAGAAGATEVSATLLRAAGRAVTAAAGGAGGDRDELAGLLAARALALAYRRAVGQGA